MESLEERRVLTSLPFGASPQDLGEFMLGSVAVTPVFLESNGQTDASTENWTAGHISAVLANIEEGLDWWVDVLATKSDIHQLSFSIDTTYALTPAETRFEPIARRSNDYTQYVGEFLANRGYSSGNLEFDARSFNQAQREKLGTDWSYTIFVVPSVNDADGQFAAGGSFNRAFAFAGGLFMVVPSTRPASTFTHESGHIFWARDEYAGGGSYFQERGYYNTENSNAADNPASGFVQQPSIMASDTLLATAYANHDSPASTLAQIGWQDSDGDGIFDVLDVPHLLTGTGYLDAASGEYRFVGSATVQTLPNRNSSGLRNDITLNRIREIEYRFDGGQWQLLVTPDSYQVELDLSIPVPTNATEIEIRARDSATTVVSNVFEGRLERADATVSSGINGFVWLDANKNGLRDVGENGSAGWTVELVDADGDVLELQQAISPNIISTGVVSSGFSPNFTLTTVGSDADGRLGVFDDPSGPTGSKTFRGYSVSSRSFLTAWNSTSRRMQINFTSPTSEVQLEALGNGNSSIGRLEAFNSSGELIGRYTTSSLANNESEVMKISRGAADIAYVIAGGHANASVKLGELLIGPAAVAYTGLQGHYAFPALPSGEYRLRVTPDSNVRPFQPTSGIQIATLANPIPATDVDFGFETAMSPWQNARDPLDVNDDKIVSALDVLLIVNTINADGPRQLTESAEQLFPFIDTSGNSFVSALDVLLVVNYINSDASGDGESTPYNEYQNVVSDTGVASPGQFSTPPASVVDSLWDDEEFFLSLRLRNELSI
jgi:hypothetical protein